LPGFNFLKGFHLLSGFRFIFLGFVPFPFYGGVLLFGWGVGCEKTKQRPCGVQDILHEAVNPLRVKELVAEEPLLELLRSKAVF